MLQCATHSKENLVRASAMVLMIKMAFRRLISLRLAKKLVMFVAFSTASFGYAQLVLLTIDISDMSAVTVTAHPTNTSSINFSPSPELTGTTGVNLMNFFTNNNHTEAVPEGNGDLTFVTAKHAIFNSYYDDTFNDLNLNLFFNNNNNTALSLSTSTTPFTGSTIVNMSAFIGQIRTGSYSSPYTGDIQGGDDTSLTATFGHYQIIPEAHSILLIIAIGAGCIAYRTRTRD